MKRVLICGLLLLCSKMGVSQFHLSAVGGYMHYQYHHNTYYDALRPPLFAGVEVDRYIGYHFAITSGVTYFRAGYAGSYDYKNASVSYKWQNDFLQIPLGLKMASKGDLLGIMVGVNFNVLLRSSVRELADSLNNFSDYIATNVTSAMPVIQPDFFFGLQVRTSRLTISMRMSTSLTNRYSTKVKSITDNNGAYYGSYYAYILGEAEGNKLKATGFMLSVSTRLF